MEFAAISLLFYKVIGSPRSQKVILIILLLAGPYLLYSIIASPIDSFNSVLAGLTYLVFLIYSIYYLFERMKDPTAIYLFSSPVFWVVVAIIIYSAGTFFPFIYAKNYMAEREFLDLYDLIHDPLYIIRNLIFAFAMLQKDKKLRSNYTAYGKKKTKP